MQIEKAISAIKKLKCYLKQMSMIINQLQGDQDGLNEVKADMDERFGKEIMQQRGIVETDWNRMYL